MNPPSDPPLSPSATSIAIREAQASFVRGVEPQRIYDELLQHLVQTTGSEFGFLCVLRPGGSASQRLALAGWGHREQHDAERARVMREMVQGMTLQPDSALLPASLAVGQVVILDKPPIDPQARGLFPEAGPIDTFLGLPLHYGGEWIGMIGLANRPRYDSALVDTLAPLVQTVAVIVAAMLVDRRRETTESRFVGMDERLRDLLGALHAGVAVVDAAGRFHEVSRRMCAIVGRTRAEMLELSLHDITHPDDLPRNQALAERLVKGSLDRHTFEKRYLRPDGEAVWVQISAAVLRDAAGRFHRSIALVLDIDERKRAERALQQREAQFSKLASKVPGVLMQFHVDTQGHASVPYANETMRELFELDPDGPVRQNASLMIDRVVKGQRGKVWGTLEASGRALKPWSLEWEIDLPTRGRRWVEGRGTPERLPDGSTLWHGYIDDITERKRYEEAVVAAEASVRANAAKTEFLSRMSHELRTPLNAVLGFAQLLASDLRSPLDEGQRLRVGHIERAGQHLLAMIGDVLDLSRIEGGSLPLALQPVPVQQLIDESFALVSTTARGAGVRLIQAGAAPGTGLHLRADPMRLRQVMVNLLSNAIKYNHPGGQVTVDVQVRRPSEGEDAAPGRVGLSVTDTGQGLTPLQQTHLFEPFNRLGAERGQVEGTGLGLAITLRLVELMAGSIGVRSEPGRGSTFVVELPLDESLGPADASSDADTGRPAPLPGVADLVVLYAEDNELNVELVRQLLMLRAGCELRVARNGREAIEAALRAPPDLLLIDMHLGDMGGVQVLEALRDDPALREVPRIALSADALPQSIEAARNAGFDEYLTKPVDIEELLRCLDRHRGGRRALRR